MRKDSRTGEDDDDDDDEDDDEDGDLSKYDLVDDEDDSKYDLSAVVDNKQSVLHVHCIYY